MAKPKTGLAILMGGDAPDEGEGEDMAPESGGREAVPEAVEDALSEAFPDMSPARMRAFLRAVKACQHDDTGDDYAEE